MPRLITVLGFCIASLLVQSTEALPAKSSPERRSIQTPLNADHAAVRPLQPPPAAGFASPGEAGVMSFVDVPYPSWMEHHIITRRKDLISTLSVARQLGPKTFTSAYPKILQAIQPVKLPLDVFAATSGFAISETASFPDHFARAADLLLSGLAGPKGIKEIVSSYDCNSFANRNTHRPKSAIYPSASDEDAPYAIPESTLRSAIRIPANFTFGKGKTPLILVPGTGVTACETYSSNYGKILANSSVADPVFLNVPERMLDDHQNNAEFVAYAINYISGISGGANVSAMAYSGGNLGVQWALKYWLSARSRVSDYIAISPDYYGARLAEEICTSGASCPPAVLQQGAGSMFSQTLGARGEHLAYVPTTVTWSMFDNHVAPQPNAKTSTEFQTAHGIGVTLNQIQANCGLRTPTGRPGLGHEGALYNAQAVAVTLDALTHRGPANLQRIKPSCHKNATDGLEVEDIMRTEALQLLAALNINNFISKVTSEPSIKAYAWKDVPKE